jgi:hypothetical protein
MEEKKLFQKVTLAFLGLPDQRYGTDLDPDPSVIKQKEKEIWKTLIPTVLCLPYDILSLKNNVRKKT